MDPNSFSVLHLRTLTLMDHPKSTDRVSHVGVRLRPQETFAKGKAPSKQTAETTTLANR